MNKKTLILVILGLSFLQIDIADSAPADIKDKIGKTQYFDEVAITGVTTYKKPGDFAGYKLLVQPVTYSKERYLPFKSDMTKSRRQLGEPLWVITGDQLPVTEDTCIKANLDGCDMSAENTYNICYNACAVNGPEFLYYDQHKNNLYFMSDTQNVGQGGGGMLVFVANIPTRKIQYLMSIGGPVTATLSPSGTYLIFSDSPVITIHSLETRKNIEIEKKNIWDTGKEQLHNLSVSSWVNDHQFIYRDYVFHDKFQNEWDSVTEYVYDITLRQNIRSRELKKSEFPDRLKNTY